MIDIGHKSLPIIIGPGHTNFPTNWNDMTFLWFDLSCSTVHVPNAGTLNCMIKKTPKCSSSHQKLF